MKVFDHKPIDVAYPLSVPNHTAEWITGAVIVVAIIGLFAYGARSSDSDRIVMTPTHEITAPPPVNPAPPSNSTKP
jgi:hypothetical protein